MTDKTKLFIGDIEIKEIYLNALEKHPLDETMAGVNIANQLKSRYPNATNEELKSQNLRIWNRGPALVHDSERDCVHFDMGCN